MKEEWNPGYNHNLTGIFIPYEKRWYCIHNKIIHGSEKEFNSCKFISLQKFALHKLVQILL